MTAAAALASARSPRERLRAWFTRHPLVRDAILWSIPALLFGGLLRVLMLHYMPYAYWGSDSRSYFDFTHKLWYLHSFSLAEKRRVLYPIYMAFVTMLPGAPLKWLPWIQHGFGLLTVIPLAYVVRRCFVFWRWWVIPVTLLFVGFPLLLWYEHELLAETLFFSFIVWSFAGWCAWAREERTARALRLFWWFFVPYTLFIITKPSGRFYWPGLCLGYLIVCGPQLRRRLGWSGHKMRWTHYVAIALLMVVTLKLGAKKYGNWLFYTATFPLTQLDTPLHHEYKAQIRDLVEPLRADLDHYYERDGVPFEFLDTLETDVPRPLWVPLKSDEEKRVKLYMDLALEGVKAEPAKALYLGFQRLVASSNLSDFKLERFSPEYQPRRFRDDYESSRARLLENPPRPTPLPLAMGMSLHGPMPPFEEVVPLISPAPDSFAAHFVTGWVEGWGTRADLVNFPKHARVWDARPTWLGWWLLAGFALSFLPRYRATLGVWTLASVGYVAGVFVFSQTNPRYFGPAWPVFIPLLAVVPDAVCCWVSSLRRPRQEVAPARLG